MKQGAFAQCDPLLPLGVGIHHDIQHFLFREALLLDHERYEEWIELLAADVRYRTPVHFARAIGVDPPAGAEYFEDDHRSLTSRIHQLRESGAATRATGHMRRLITNVIACPRRRDEYDVLSYLLIALGSPAENASWLLSAERHDHLRRAAQSFRIVRREIIVDRRQAAAGAIDLFL
jgi:ethylbenzene dioxygenase beta subunit